MICLAAVEGNTVKGFVRRSLERLFFDEATTRRQGVEDFGDVVGLFSAETFREVGGGRFFFGSGCGLHRTHAVGERFGGGDFGFGIFDF